MGEKKIKCGFNAKKIHLCEIDSCGSLVLHMLSLKEIVRSKVVSKWFGKRSCEALGLITHSRHGPGDRCLGHLLVYCRNIKAISPILNVRNIYNVFSALRIWRNLKVLELNGILLKDRPLQELIIPQMAELVPNLEALHLLDMFNTAKVYLAPLGAMKRLRRFAMYFGRPNKPEVVGLEIVLRNCPIYRLVIDESCDFLTVASVCETAAIETLEMLVVFNNGINRLCSTLARLSNLQTLCLSSSIPDDGIEELSRLQHLKSLRVSFNNLTPRVLNCLINGFPALTKVEWSGSLPLNGEWLEVLERSHGGLVVEHVS